MRRIRVPLVLLWARCFSTKSRSNMIKLIKTGHKDCSRPRRDASPEIARNRPIGIVWKWAAARGAFVIPLGPTGSLQTCRTLQVGAPLISWFYSKRWCVLLDEASWNHLFSIIWYGRGPLEPIMPIFEAILSRSTWQDYPNGTIHSRVLHVECLPELAAQLAAHWPVYIYIQDRPHMKCRC